MSERDTPSDCGPTHHMGFACREEAIAAEIATLRTRAEQAESAHARHAADRSREVTELHRAHERALRRAEQAEAERDNLRFNYGQALADADHHKQESEIHHAAFIEAFDRATKAEAERDLFERRAGEFQTALDAMQERAEKAEAEAARYKEREAHFATVLGVTDRGQYRADWDSRIRALLDEVARLREELRLANIDIGVNKAEAEARTSEAATLANEVARLRALLDDVCMLRGAGRAGYERGLREAAGVCTKTIDHITERLNADIDHPDVWARLDSRRQALEVARESILALLDAKEGGG